MRIRFSTASAIMKMGWGLWLLIPFFDTFESGKVFMIMQKIAPESVWGIVIVSIAALHFYYLRYRKFYLVSKLLSAGIWICIATAFALANINSPGSITFVSIAVMEMINKE